jgi:hypothetical protein
MRRFIDHWSFDIDHLLLNARVYIHLITSFAVNSIFSGKEFRV